MKKFIDFYEERREINESLLSLAFLPDNVESAINKVFHGSALVAIQRSLTDLFSAGLRIIGRNPLKTSFALLAIDQLVNRGRGTDKLIAYLENDFGTHAAMVVDVLKKLLDAGFGSEDAADIVTEVIKKSS